MRPTTRKTNEIFYVGSRGSQLALWQAHSAIARLQVAYPHLSFAIKTYRSAGDIETEKPLPAIEGKGVFTKVLDDALINKEIHIAVHSHKDLPIVVKSDIKTAAVLKRERVNGVVIAKHKATLLELPQGSIIGTSSTRRSAQLLALKRGFITKNIRGNVETRIKKALDNEGGFQATLLAYAGVHRLNLLDYCTEILDVDTMLPAPAQGSIAIQCLKDSHAFSLSAAISDVNTRRATKTERGFLYGLGGGCSMPIAAYAYIEDDTIFFRGKVLAKDGSSEVFIKESYVMSNNFSIDNAFCWGVDLANLAIKQGACDLLELGY